MATNELTEKAILAALKQAQREGRPVKASDGEGMHLEAQPNGRAWWRLRYRFGGRETMLSLGTYPDTTLAQARRNRALRREQLAAGIDPSEAKRAEVEADKADVQARAREAAGLPPADAFSVVAREWHAVHATKTSASYALQVLRNLERDVFPWIGLRPVHAVEADEVLAVLRRVEARGAVETTRRLRHTLGQVFSFAGGECTRARRQSGRTRQRAPWCGMAPSVRTRPAMRWAPACTSRLGRCRQTRAGRPPAARCGHASPRAGASCTRARRRSP
jgi:hypothetical protein